MKNLIVFWTIISLLFNYNPLLLKNYYAIQVKLVTIYTSFILSDDFKIKSDHKYKTNSKYFRPIFYF